MIVHIINYNSFVVHCFFIIHRFVHFCNFISQLKIRFSLYKYIFIDIKTKNKHIIDLISNMPPTLYLTTLI